MRSLLRLMALAVTIVAAPAWAAYPEKPIKIVFPNAAGGEADIILRMMLPELEKLVPQPIVVTDMPGAGTALGSRWVREQPADGYTILYIHQAMLGVAAQGVLGFEHTEFTPFAKTGRFDVHLVARAGAPYTTLKEMVTYATANPGAINAGVFLTANLHFIMLGIQEAAGIQLKMVNVPGGGGPQRAALLGGHIDITTMGSGPASTYAKNGSVVPLAFLAEERDRSFPDVPTSIEQGVGYTHGAHLWWWFRKEVPVEIQAWWADRIEQVMSNTALVEKLRREGGLTDTTFLRGEALKADVAREAEAYRRIVDKYNMRKQP